MNAGGSAPNYGAHFARLAATYDGLRAGPSDEAVEALVREGDLRGRRVLDVGCGTGRLAEILTVRYGATVTGVDPSERMLEVARNRMPARALRLRVGSAEDLPFDGGVFERAVMQVVVHLVDRRRALPEIHRVLGADGRLVIATVDPALLERYWLSELFPSYVEIDRRRFPEPQALVSELEAAGFAAARWTPFDERNTYGRDEALGMIRGRFASSFALMGEEEYRAGLRRAERELPAEFESTLRFAIVTAYR